MPKLPLPALHDAASSMSAAAQERLKTATVVQLTSLVGAAVGGAITVKTKDGLHVGAVVGLVGFLVALAMRAYLAAKQPAKAWYEGRAAAESVKTLAWRYAVGGHPFVVDLAPSEADRLFVVRCSEILKDLETLEGESEQTSQITDGMRALRSAPLADRKAAYRDGRIEDQRRWYSAKAAWNRQRRQRWELALLALELCGLLSAVARVARWIDLNIIGLTAACAAAVTAWVQSKQHEQLAVAYSITAQELAGVGALIGHADDDDSWAVFVQDAEEAISREHTLWRASRGVRLGRRAPEPPGRSRPTLETR